MCRIKTYVSALLPAAVFFLFAAGCGKEEEKTYRVSSVTFDREAIILGVGKTVTLGYSVKPSLAADRSVTFSSDNTGVAKVNGKGVVSGIAVGKATVTVKTGDGGKTDECLVNVLVPVDVTGVKLDKTKLPLVVGVDVGNTLTVNIEPSNATNKTVKWKSGDNTVATVDKGKVTALKKGTAKITVTTEEGGFTADCAVTVVDTAADYYYGTWKYTYATGYIQATITAEKVVEIYNGSDGYTVSITQWDAITNSIGSYKDTYPTGYRITGRLDAVAPNYNLQKADGSGETTQTPGDLVNVWWYIHADTGSLRDGLNAYTGPWVKQ